MLYTGAYTGKLGGVSNVHPILSIQYKCVIVYSLTYAYTVGWHCSCAHPCMAQSRTTGEAECKAIGLEDVWQQRATKFPAKNRCTSPLCNSSMTNFVYAPDVLVYSFMRIQILYSVLLDQFMQACIISPCSRGLRSTEATPIVTILSSLTFLSFGNTSLTLTARIYRYVCVCAQICMRTCVRG